MAKVLKALKLKHKTHLNIKQSLKTHKGEGFAISTKHFAYNTCWQKLKLSVQLYSQKQIYSFIYQASLNFSESSPKD